MEDKPEEREPYVEPKVLATYKKEELEEIIKTQGAAPPLGSPQTH